MTSVNYIVSGFKWTAGSKFAGQLFNWVVTIVVIRLLEPEDYGVFAVAVAVMTFMSLLSEFGIGDGLIRKKDFSENLLKKTFGYILIINITLFSLLYLCSSLIAEFYEREQLTRILHVQAFEFLIMSLFIIPAAKMRHDMRFKRLSLINLLANVTGGGITLFFALNGFGVWSLVWGNIGRLLILVVLTQIAEPTFLLPDFDIRDLHGVGSFGFVVLLTRLVFFFYTKADILIISKILNTEVVGLYAVAKDLATRPLANLASSVNLVAFSAFSKFDEKAEKLTDYYLKAITSLGFISFPVFFGISSVAPEIVPLVLGEKWTESTIILQLIALSIPFRLLNVAQGALLQGAGSALVNLKNTTIGFFVFVPLFVFALRWGILGVASVWAVVMPVYFFYIVTTLKAYVNISAMGVFKELAWPIFTSLIMFFVVRALAMVLDSHSVNGIIMLVIEILLGTITYFGANFIFNNGQFMHFVSLARRR